MAGIPRMLFVERLKKDVTIMNMTTVKSISPTDVTVDCNGTTKVLRGFDSVVMAVGYKAKNDLVQQVSSALPGVELHVSGVGILCAYNCLLLKNRAGHNGPLCF